MPILTNAAAFTTNRQDLKKIYLTYIRSVLDQSSVLKHSILSQKNIKDLERVQKVAVRVIMGKNFNNYQESLLELNLKNLNARRQDMCLNFAKKSVKNNKVKNMFPKNLKSHTMKKRRNEVYQIKKHKTKRYKRSAIPYMAQLLNIDKEKRKQIINGLY